MGKWGLYGESTSAWQKNACSERHDLEILLARSTSKERWSYIESRIYGSPRPKQLEKWSVFTMWRLRALRKYTLRNLKLRQCSRSIKRARTGPRPV